VWAVPGHFRLVRHALGAASLVVHFHNFRRSGAGYWPLAAVLTIELWGGEVLVTRFSAAYIRSYRWFGARKKNF